MKPERVIHIQGQKYIRADIAERWLKQRDLLKDFKTKVHKYCHDVRRAIAASEKES